MDDSKIFAKKLVLDLLKENEIERTAISLVVKILNDPEIKNEAKEVLKWVVA